MFTYFNIDKIYQFLLITLAFLIPLTVFGANLIIVLICIIWLFSGKYKSKLDQIINNKLLLVSILFFGIHVLGLLWTDDFSWGMHMVHKMWYFLALFPILFSLVRKEFIRYYIYSFLTAIAITEVFSYLIWFEVLEPFKYASVENPTPFMSHISYNPILAFAIYLVLHEIFFNKKLTNLIFSIYSFFALSMSMNMFITGGRAGQVAFFVVIGILIIQVFPKQRIKSLLIILFIIPSIFITAYQTSELFSSRVNSAVNDVLTLANIANTFHSSVGLRVNFARNSLELINQNLLFGVGTGDYPLEYKRINQVNSPELPNTTNPHNMYILVLAQTGLIGLISMLTIFYFQIKLSFNSSNKFFRDVGLTLPIMFLVLMISDSYLLGHYTTLMYIFFSSFLYKDFEKN